MNKTQYVKFLKATRLLCNNIVLIIILTKVFKIN